MAVLSFKVQADIQKVKDLRNEIVQLEATMKRIKSSMPTADVGDLEKRLSTAKTELVSVTTQAAKAGATFGEGLKKKMNETSRVVNDFTGKIIEQKAVIRDIEGDVKKLGDAYSKAVKTGAPNASAILGDYKSAKRALEEEKAALFGLNQEKAKAQLQVRRLSQEYKEYKGSAGGVAKETDGFAASFKKLATGLVGVKALKEFVGQVVRVRGEFKDMETAISTLAGDEMASKLIPQLKEMAKISPLKVSDFVNAEKTMLGFNIAAEDTIKYLQALSDISMGNSQRFNSLTLAFSQMSATGKLMGQDLNQMINAGFNPLQVIAEKTGKSIAQLKKEMSAGAISAEMVQQAFIDATSAGGKFYNMSQNAAKTINGQISMLEDAVDNMFNQLGTASEGVIMASIQGVTKIVENYEAFGGILLSLVATYGTYKGAVMAVTAIEKAAAAQQIVLSKGTDLLRLSYSLLTKQVTALNAALMANPFAIAAAAVVALVGGAIMLGKAMDKNGDALERINKASDEYNQKVDEQDRKARSLIATIQDESKSTSQKVKAYNELKALIPDIAEKYTLEELAIKGVVDANKDLAKWREEAEKKGRKERLASLRIAEKELVDSINGRVLTGKKVDPAERERLAEIQKQIKELQAMDKQVAAANNKVEVHNKEYWEKKKSAAEAKLQALDISQKGSKEWRKYEKEIQEAQKNIDKYSTSKTEKTEKESNQQEAKKAENLRKIEEYKKAVLDAQQQAQFDIRQAEIDAMEEGTAKTLAQINLDYDKKIAENKKKEQEFIKSLAEQKALEWEVQNPELAKKGQKFDKSSVKAEDLTPAQKAVLKTNEKIAESQRELAEKNVYKNLLEKYQTYMQKREAIDKKYEADKKAIKNVDGTYKSGFSKENEAILDKEHEDALAAVDVEFAMKEESFKKWADSVTGMSLKRLNELLTEAENELVEMENKIEEGEGGEISDESLKKVRAKKKVLEDAVKGKKLDGDWKELYQTLNDIADEFDEIGNIVGGTAGEIISLAGTTASGVISMIDGVKAVGKSGAEALSTVEKASVILAIISTAIKIVTKIINLANELHDKKHEKEIERLQEQVDGLEKNYDTLGDAIEKAYSKDASKLINQQNELLRQQKQLIQQQIAEEDAKKKTDEGKINSYKEKIADIDKTLEENKQKAIDAIFGEDLQSAIENFAQAYADAVASGGDKWVSVKDTVKNMMKQMVVESIKGALTSSKAIENIRTKLEEFYKDGVLSVAEQDYIYKMAEGVQKELDRQFGWSADLFKNDDSTEQKATYGGFETMSEDTGTELNGRFTALQMAGEEIKREAIAQTIALNEIKGSLDAYLAANGGMEVKTSLDNMLTFVSQSYMELQQINENTAANVKELKSVSSFIRKWDTKIMSL